jgi:Xaa-Pro aminopeptidase
VDWLLNIRGADVPHTPLALAFAIVPASGRPQLLIDPAKLTAEVEARLAALAEIVPMRQLLARLRLLKQAGGRIALDPATASYWFALKLKGKQVEIVKQRDPCVLPRAIKNTAEIKGMRQAHIRDGVAVSRFLCWLAQHGHQGIDEIAAAQKLEALREESGELRDLSFETISGAGPNGAIVHYRVNEASNRRLKSGELYLVDSGGQYRDGTTDITRTVAIGTPGNDLIEDYTLVLKGHIAIATARFPKGTRGIDLDALARINLWKAGLDYDHGTGHGVGAYLGVHEGPQSISKRGMAELLPGMIVSNEPGYYRAGRYGIRIENLVLVTPGRTPEGGEREMMGFETLTLAPLDLGLVDPDMLERHELDWLNDYHRTVRETLSPLLPDKAERDWLRQATEHIGPPPQARPRRYRDH